MGSRTQVRQQMMRQKVLEDEKFNSYSSGVGNISYSCSSSNCLPSLTSTLTSNPDTNSFRYCKPVTQEQNENNLDFNLLDFNSDNMSYGLRSDLEPTFTDIYAQPVVHQYLEMKSNVNNLNTCSDSNGVIINASQSYETSYSCPLVSNNYQNPPLHHNSVSIPISTNDMMSPSSVVSSMLAVSNDDIKKSNGNNNAQMKDRNKKESHNRIERKRRDYINQQITILSTIIPAHLLTDGDVKKNKGSILKNSVEYVQNLQNECASIPNLVHEIEMGFQLVNFYKKRLQDLEALPCSPKSPHTQQMTDMYHSYLSLHEQNQRSSINNTQNSYRMSQQVSPSSPSTNQNSSISNNAQNSKLLIMSPSHNNSGLSPSTINNPNSTNGVSPNSMLLSSPAGSIPMQQQPQQYYSPTQPQHAVYSQQQQYITNGNHHSTHSNIHSNLNSIPSIQQTKLEPNSYVINSPQHQNNYNLPNSFSPAESSYHSFNNIHNTNNHFQTSSVIGNGLQFIDSMDCTSQLNAAN